MLLGRNARRRHVLATLNRAQAQLHVELATRDVVLRQPFLDDDLWVVAGDVVWVVQRNTGERYYQVIAIGGAGDTLAVQTYEYNARSINLSRTLDSLQTVLGEGSDELASRRLIERELFVPSHLPPVHAAVGMSDASIWLLLATDSADRRWRWQVLSADAEPMVVSGPSGVWILESNEMNFWGIGFEAAAPYVSRFVISKQLPPD